MNIKAKDLQIGRLELVENRRVADGQKTAKNEEQFVSD
jgi:hypothetical protein